MSGLYECRICNVIYTDGDRLCVPLAVESRRGDARPLEEKLQQMCTPLREEVRYVCERCGRPSASPMLVCRARALPGPGG